MIYSRLMKVCIALSVVAFLTSSILFATTSVADKSDKVIDNIMEILIRVQKYSWPVALIVLLGALYQYYVLGSEAFEYKVNGQKLIMGISIFMTVIQCLPLIYAFVTIGL